MIKTAFNVEEGDPEFDKIRKEFLKIYSENISPYGIGLSGPYAFLNECMKNIMGEDWGMPAYLYTQTYLKFLLV